MASMLLQKIPDFIVTFSGVLLGVFGGGLFSIMVAKWQFKKQESRDKKRDLELLTVISNRVYLELDYNKHTTKELRNTLELCTASRNDIWGWAISIVDSYSTVEYDNLLRSGLTRILPSNVNHTLYASYKNIVDLSHTVKKARLAHSFYYGYSANEKEANALYERTKDSLGSFYIKLNENLEVIKRYNNDLQNKKSDVV